MYNIFRFLLVIALATASLLVVIIIANNTNIDMKVIIVSVNLVFISLGAFFISNFDNIELELHIHKLKENVEYLGRSVDAYRENYLIFNKKTISESSRKKMSEKAKARKRGPNGKFV